MHVFVAGATGAMGVPLVRRLIAAGHRVTGLTRSEAKRPLLEGLGATAVVADIFDRKRLIAVLQDARPEAVVHLLTALPKRGPMRASDLVLTNRLRIEGTKNLVEASIAAGVRRLVAESIVLVYGFGEHGPEPLTEEHPVARSSPRPWLQPTIDAGQVRMVKKRAMPLFGGGSGLWPWIHLEDMATATIAALEKGRSGEIYNIVDDEPVTWRDYLYRLAEVLGAPKPFRLPTWIVRLVAPYAALVLTSRLPTSNAKARRELGWQPSYPTFREGLATLARG